MMSARTSEEGERLLSSSEDTFTLRRQSRAGWLWVFLTLINVTLFLASIAFFTQFRSAGGPLNAQLRATSFYSPILDDKEIPTFDYEMEGSISIPEHPQLGKWLPSKETDEAWAKLYYPHTFVLTREEVVKLGKDPNTAARFPDEQWGLGDEAYMGQLDVVHQIHCLNNLRQRAFAPYFGEPLKPRPETSWVHLAHCTSILLQNLMCNANTDIITMKWIEEQDRPMPDFAVKHKCRDLRPVLDWGSLRAVDHERWLNMTKPTRGHAILHGDPKWFALYDELGEPIYVAHNRTD